MFKKKSIVDNKMVNQFNSKSNYKEDYMPIAWLEAWFENKGSWFDLVACCYSNICCKRYHPAQFLSYFEGELCREDSVLDSVIDGISAAVIDNPRPLGKSRKNALNKVKCLLEMAYPNYSFSIYADSVLCWVVIAGVDKAFSELNTSIGMEEVGPLNNLKKDEVGVYYKAEDSVIKRILSAYGVEQSPEGRLSERLQAFDLAKGIDLFPLPVIKRPLTSLVDLRKGSSLSSAHDVSLRIGIAACTDASLFGKEDKDCIVCKCNESGALSFQYPLCYEERYEEIVGRSLQKAIDLDCDIVIYPELVMSSNYIKKLQFQLKSVSDTRALQLVVAGSGWEHSDRDSFGKNLCQVLDKQGRIQARTTKKVPFIDDSKEKQLVENLDPEAHETTLLDLNGFGRLMTMVCKDLETDDSYASRMAAVFRPDLVCVPAASGSVEGAFRVSMNYLAERAHAICCVANLCSMVERHEDKDLISYISAPNIKDRESHHSRFPFCLYQGCYRNNNSKTAACKNPMGACIFVADINYCSDSEEGVMPSIEIKTVCS